LDSAWAAVMRYLILIHADDETWRKFYRDWGVNAEWKDGKKSPKPRGPPRGPMPGLPGDDSESDELAIPHEHNLLAQHLALYKDPE
jgi:hypothetical protein